MFAGGFLANTQAFPHDAGHVHIDASQCYHAEDLNHDNHLDDHFSAFLSGPRREAKLADDAEWQSDRNFVTNVTIVSTVMNGAAMVLALGSAFYYYFATRRYRKALNREEFPTGLPVNLDVGDTEQTTPKSDAQTAPQPDAVDAEA
eukprot:GEMP01039751.1.p1 GENE.GEMP01039751.1~~GEMP01039751.1.p1  ORF type:complete len:146 (+),score=36.79 GEMP01039751.1:114-551(+)